MASPRLNIGRHSQTGACYAVTTVTRGRAQLMANPQAAHIVATELQAMRTHVQSLAWVVMPDHLHWVLQLRNEPLSTCLQRFKSNSARALNHVRGMSGQVWQGGFYDHRLRHDEDLREQVLYVLANPLRAGLATRLQDYPHWWCCWPDAAHEVSAL